MATGIIVTAVGDELSIAHPTVNTDISTALLICGGPALFLAGHAMFKFAVWNRISMSRLLATALLLVLVPIATILPLVMTAIIATAVVIGVILGDASILRMIFARQVHPRLESAEAEGIPLDEA